MSVPTPPVTLKGHCSAIHNNTLYVYTPEAFLSLPLEVNGTWQELSMGQAVTDAVCVKGGTDGDNTLQSLYVVGGTTNSSDYSGLQRYSFDNAQWETMGSPGTSLQNRTNHGATYINSTASIVVYAGSQDGSSAMTTSTFLVSTVSPFDITSLTSQDALPMVSPVLLPWDENSAVLMGGNSTTTSVFVFNSTGGWQDSSVSLAQELPGKDKCALVSGSDGSKVLEIFDMSTSPNTVTRVALLDAGGVAAPAGQLVGTSTSSAVQQTSATKTRRALTLADYPVYNGTFASNVTRSSFSLAQDGNGLVVISGGSETEPLCVFDSSTNRWLNTTKLFYGDDVVQQPLHSTSSTSSATSTTVLATTTAMISSTPAATSSAASSTKSGSGAGTIIGATLGSMLGFAGLLIAILLLLRWLRQKKEKANGQIKDKDRLSFQDRGIEPLARSAVPMARGPVPRADSLAIVTGNVNGIRSLTSPAISQRDLFAEKTRSPLTTGRTETSGSDRYSPTRSWLDGPPSRDRTTDEGWSKYFEDNKAVDTKSPRSSVSSDQTRSDYRNSAWPNVASGLTPLNLGILNDRTPLGRVPTGSPSTEHPSQRLFVQEGQSARISSADSVSLISDDADYDRDAYSSGVPASITDEGAWRPASSNYTNSVYASTYARDTLMPPSRSARNSQGNNDDADRAKARVSSTIIPQQYSHDDQPTRSNVNSDMSWLNLHAGN